MKFCDLVYISEIAYNDPTVRSPQVELQLGKDFIIRMIQSKARDTIPKDVLEAMQEYISGQKTFDRLVNAVNKIKLFGTITAEQLREFIDEGQQHVVAPPHMMPPE